VASTAFTQEQIERLTEKLSRHSMLKENGCIEWTAGKNQYGYGVTHLWPKNFLAHRIAWCLVHGPIPLGLCVLHRCDNPACVNVEHLFLGTQQDNLADMRAKGRARQGHADRRGALSPMAKLTEEQARTIKTEAGTHAEIAKRYGIAQQTVSDIKSGRRWRHLNG
jgi:hypothetical protein